jgi:hypothetical protein
MKPMTAVSCYSLPKSEPIKIELPKVVTQYESPSEIDIPNFESPAYVRNIYSLAINTPPITSPNKTKKLTPHISVKVDEV